MVNARSFVISISCAVLSAASLVYPQAVKPSEAKAAPRQPAAIQELQLQPQRLLALSLPAPFRLKFVAGLQRAFTQGELGFSGDHKALRDRQVVPLL